MKSRLVIVLTTIALLSAFAGMALKPVQGTFVPKPGHVVVENDLFVDPDGGCGGSVTTSYASLAADHALQVRLEQNPTCAVDIYTARDTSLTLTDLAPRIVIANADIPDETNCYDYACQAHLNVTTLYAWDLAGCDVIARNSTGEPESTEIWVRQSPHEELDDGCYHEDRWTWEQLNSGPLKYSHIRVSTIAHSSTRHSCNAEVLNMYTGEWYSWTSTCTILPGNQGAGAGWGPLTYVGTVAAGDDLEVAV